MSLPLQRNFKAPANSPKSFYERYFGLGEGSGLFICFFKFWKKSLLLTVSDSREQSRSSSEKNKLCKYSSKFQVTCLQSYVGSFWKPSLPQSFQNLFSMFLYRALLFTTQSCKPEKPSWCNPEAELVWRQDTAHQMSNRKCLEGHSGREMVSQVMCTRLCDIRCSRETSHKKGQDSNQKWYELDLGGTVCSAVYSETLTPTALEPTLKSIIVSHAIEITAYISQSFWLF